MGKFIGVCVSIGLVLLDIYFLINISEENVLTGIFLFLLNVGFFYGISRAKELKYHEGVSNTRKKTNHYTNNYGSIEFKDK